MRYGLILPSTTPRRAPVAEGRFDGRRRQVSYAVDAADVEGNGAQSAVTKAGGSFRLAIHELNLCHIPLTSHGHKRRIPGFAA